MYIIIARPTAPQGACMIARRERVKRDGNQVGRRVYISAPLHDNLGVKGKRDGHLYQNHSPTGA